MKKYTFSALISCSLLLAAAQTNGQSFGQNGAPIVSSTTQPAGLSAYRENNNVFLRWTTGYETNIDHYVIERSTDSIHFDPLHEVVSKSSVSLDSNYQDFDGYPTSPVNYYRLRTVLTNGKSFYSAAVRVDMDTRKLINLSPTVLHMGGTLRMDNYHEQPVTINFFNANGTLMGSFLINSTSFDIPSQGWSKGVFFYRVSDKTHALINSGKIMIL